MLKYTKKIKKRCAKKEEVIDYIKYKKIKQDNE